MLTAPAVIEGVRLRLRRSVPGDAAAVFSAAANPEVMKYMDWPAHRTQADVQEFLEGCATRWTNGTEFHWMIEEKQTNASVGCLACRPKGHAADFGYFLARTHWGKGIAQEAAMLLVSWLKRQPEVLRVWATTDAENHRSARVLEKAGLRLEGNLRMATIRPNIGPIPRDTCLYAWVRGDA